MRFLSGDKLKMEPQEGGYCLKKNQNLKPHYESNLKISRTLNYLIVNFSKSFVSNSRRSKVIHSHRNYPTPKIHKELENCIYIQSAITLKPVINKEKTINTLDLK